MAQSCHRLGRLEGQKGLDPVIRCTCDKRQQSGTNLPFDQIAQMTGPDPNRKYAAAYLVTQKLFELIQRKR
jgi:hypothetical protein